MRLIYFDEVKYDPPQQKYYWLGGISVDADCVQGIENQVNALSEECFSSATLTRETEFHSVDIYHRKRNFKGWRDISSRIDLLEKLARILDQPEKIRKIYVRIDPRRMLRQGWEADAFMYLLNAVRSMLRA